MTAPVLDRPPATAPYRDPSRPISERVADLVARMTREEKLAQIGSKSCAGFLAGASLQEPAAKKLIGQGIGELSRLAGSSGFRPSEVAAIANSIQRFLVEKTRLGIPAIFSEESISGLMARGAPMFPIPLAMGASFDPDLVGQVAGTIRERMAGEGLRHTLAPVLDLGRDPRWGRIEETYGEDPYLAAATGVAYVAGIQGTGTGAATGGVRAGGVDLSGGVLATGKHFAGHGSGEAGLNQAPAHLGPRELREEVLLPFEAAVRVAGLASVMPAYTDVDGMPCHANSELLTDILRDEWGFDGFVHADHEGIAHLATQHRMATGFEEAAALAISAGVDMETSDAKAYGSALAAAIDRGVVGDELLDRAVSRVLAVKFRLGLFDRPYVDVESSPALDQPTDRERTLARRLAVRSIVLLENDGILPLSPEVRRVAVVGPLADSTRELFGDYSYVATLETLREMTMTGRPRYWLETNPFAAIERELAARTSVFEAAVRRLAPAEVTYARGCDLIGEGSDAGAEIDEAVARAREADIAIVVVGERCGMVDECTCGESRDRREIGLPGRQRELVEAVVLTGTPVVLVVMSGRPLALEWEASACAAVVMAWAPGDEGAEAIWDVLLGDANPGGKLPVTVPRAVGAVPQIYSHRPSAGVSHWKTDYVDGDVTPLWPFGFGRSYTTFELSNLRVSPASIPTDGGEVAVEVDIANTGSRRGDEVVQLYVRDLTASVTRPVLELRGFRRVALQPGERRTVSFILAAEQLCLYDPSMRRVVEPGPVRLFVGTSSADLPLSADIHLSGAVTEIRERRRYVTETSIR